MTSGAKAFVRAAINRPGPFIFAFLSPILLGWSTLDANMPRLNKSMVYLGPCIIAGVWHGNDSELQGTIHEAWGINFAISEYTPVKPGMPWFRVELHGTLVWRKQRI